MRQTLTSYADAINAADARAAADCYTTDAVYVDPPDKLLFHGREELFEFFSDCVPPPPGEAALIYHHLVVDEPAALAFVEYTYHGRNTYHGIAIVRFRDGLIASWREYQYQSALSFEEFAGSSLLAE